MTSPNHWCANWKFWPLEAPNLLAPSQERASTDADEEGDEDNQEG